MQIYTYRGDRLTDPALKGLICTWERRNDGKCVRGRNGNALVRWCDSGELCVVLARQLRKVLPTTD